MLFMVQALLFSYWPGSSEKANYKEAERFMRGNAEKLVGSTKVSPFEGKDSFGIVIKRAMEPHVSI